MEEEFEMEEIEPVQEIEAPVERDPVQAIIDHAREDLSGIGIPGQFAETETLYEDPRGLWDKASDWFIDKFLPEVGGMLVEEWNAGATEIGKALYGHADGFVLYPHLAIEPVEPPSYETLLNEASRCAVAEQEQQQELEM